MIDRAVEHLGADRAGRYLRKFYPWYVERLGGNRALQAAVQQAVGVDAVRGLMRAATVAVGAAA